MEKQTAQRQTVPQQFNKLFNDHYAVLLKRNVFEPISPKFREWRKLALKALRFSSTFVTGYAHEDFNDILAAAKGLRPFTMHAFSAVSNNLDSRSAKDLGISLERYGAILKVSHELIGQWNLANDGLIQKATISAKEEVERIAKQAAEENKQDASLNGGGKTIKMDQKN